MAEINTALAKEAAEVLLTAIKEAAPNANARGASALKELAEAYALVRDAMPKERESRRAYSM